MKDYSEIKQRLRAGLQWRSDRDDREYVRMMRRALFYIESGTAEEFGEVPKILDQLATHFELEPEEHSDQLVDAIRRMVPRPDEEARTFEIKYPKIRDYTAITLKYSEAGYVRLIIKAKSPAIAVEDIPALIAWLEKWQKEEVE